jgi:ATP-dependent DNA ligase
VVIGPDACTDFEALRRRGAGDIAVLYAFDLRELDGNDLHSLPSSRQCSALFEEPAGPLVGKDARERNLPASCGQLA